MISYDLKKFSERLDAIEEDLSNLKEADKDRKELKQIHERLANYSTSPRTEDLMKLVRTSGLSSWLRHTSLY